MDASTLLVRRRGADYEQVTLDTLRRENPDVTFSDKPTARVLAHFGVELAELQPPPPADDTLDDVEWQITEVEGRLVQTWAPRTKSLRALRHAVIQAAERRCQQTLEQGATVQVNGQDHRVSCDANVLLYLSMTSAADLTPIDLPATDASGQQVLIPSTMETLAALRAFVLSCYQQLWASTAQVSATNNAAQLRSLVRGLRDSGV